MEVFPTLSVTPTKITQTFEDSTIRSKFDAGFEITRQRFTRDRSTFEVAYTSLERVNKNLLIDFLKTVKGSVEFTWKNHDEEIVDSDPKEYQEYIVRFSVFPTIPALGSKPNFYNISFTVVEM